MTALATAALPPDLADALDLARDVIAAPYVDRIARNRAAIPCNRLTEARRNRPCMVCGDRPTSAYLAGPLCPNCAPPSPVGYCAPRRCYCPGDSCQRPA